MRDRRPARSPLPLLLAALLLAAGAEGARGQQHLFPEDERQDYEEAHTTWVYPPWKHTWGIVRARPLHMAVFTLGRAHFHNPQGLSVVKLKRRDDPESRKDDDEVTVYGVNSGENAIIYNTSMTSIGLFGYDRQTRGVLSAPWDVAANPEGLLFVTDSGNRRVVKLRDIEGKLRLEADFGREGEGALLLPRGLDLTAGGRVVVADAAADRVVAFDTSGRFLWAIGGLEGPLGLAAVDREDRIHRPRREYVVVSEREGTRIRKYSFDGRLLAEAAVPPGPEGRPARAGHLEVDLYHNVVATDSVHHRLLKFTPELDFLAAWGEPGVGRSRFRGPTGIAVWPPFGQTFVAEGKGAHYLWVGLDWVERPSVRVDGSRPFLFLRVAPSERAVVRCELVNRQGEVVRRKARLVRPGSHLLSWHLARRGWERRDGGAIRIVHRDPPEPGPYTLRMTARAAYSSRRHHALEEEIEIVLPAWPAEEGVRDREGRGRSAPR